MTFNVNSPIKIIPLGGTGNVTNNMYVYESSRDIIIVDCGIGFPEDAIPGIDLTIPDITYLRDKLSKIRGIVITHGHEDHIGGLPFIIPQLGESIPIYTGKLTAGFIKEKFREYNLDPQFINVVKDRQPISLGDFEVKLIPVTHSVPDTKHLIIKTPNGQIYHGADFKFDWTPIGQDLPDIQSITRAGAEGVNLLLSDSLRSEKAGYSLSESIVEDSFEREFRGCEGKVVVTTMSSNISRIQQALWVAKRHNRKVALVGFSIERNVEVATELGFLQIPPRLMIDKRKIKSLPDEQVCIIAAGSQGQLSSSLDRLASGNHQAAHLEPGDKVIFSSDPIPGNEKNVYRIIDMLSKKGIVVSYSDISSDLHVSGHASSRELMMLMAMTKPHFVMPIGGTYRHMIQYRKLAGEMGIGKERVMLSENEEIVMEADGSVHLGEAFTLKTVYVESGEITTADNQITDRKLMFQEGVVVVLLEKIGDHLGIDLIPKGITKFIDESTMLEIKKSLANSLGAADITRDKLYSKDKVAKEVSRLFVDKVGKNPVVIPVIIED
ncbi:MAG: ribonuclease J [bacterium]